MRLSTESDQDEGRAIAVVHAALEAGVRFFDTADAYCLDEGAIGHNERLLRRALDSWGGDVAGVVVATKGGLRRPDGRWVVDGRARHLVEACEAQACFARTHELLGLPLEALFCPHADGPPACWCRKPLPGLGVLFIERHRLDASRCLYVGDDGNDRSLARRLGFQYSDQRDFFPTASAPP